MADMSKPKTRKKAPPRVPTKNHPSDELYDSDDDLYDEPGPGRFRDGSFVRKAEVVDRYRSMGQVATPEPHGQLRLLQMKVKGRQPRLNPHVPLAEATDCGANTLFSFEDVLTKQDADKLSEHQNCHRQGAYFEDFSRYLFTSIRRRYDIVGMDQAALLRMATTDLESGKGTVLFMGHRDAAGRSTRGHYVALCKIEDKIVLIDSQNGTETEGIEAIQRSFATRGCNFFRVPYFNEKRARDREGGRKRTRKRKPKSIRTRN